MFHHISLGQQQACYITETQRRLMIINGIMALHKYRITKQCQLRT